jgi:UDP-N-acetylglucosamine diphosphorylase/glucosamine-1-phosphate N-acetyltransferase
MENLATIILAAGKGTRMKSKYPKVTFKLAGKSFIERVVETALKTGSDEIAVVVGYKKDIVIDSVMENEKVRFVEQIEQNGTGHAVMMAEDVLKNFKGNILILSGDVPLLSSETLEKMIIDHIQTNSACTVLTAVLDDAAHYGRIIRDNEGFVKKIVEFKDASEEERKIKEINTGIYCFKSESLFSSLKKITNDNKQNEYYLTDTLEILQNNNEKISAVILENSIEAAGVNSPKQLAELEMVFYKNIKNKWLDNGVVIENPDSVIIGEKVKIDRDVIIKANSIILGDSFIGEDSFIGYNSHITDSYLGKSSYLEGFNIVKNYMGKEKLSLKFMELKING